MASIYDLKPAFQARLRPVAVYLVSRRVTANQVTGAALILSCLAGLALCWFPGSTAPLLLLPAVMLVRMALNALDGMMAREHDQASPLGALLNEISDVLADAALYLPLAFVPSGQAPLIICAVVLGLATEIAGLAALLIGAPRGYQGPMGKSDRAVAFSVFAVLAAFGASSWFLTIMAAGIAVAAAVTIANRMRHALAVHPIGKR
jgi:CDP-diacylglycerol---glycerol-3-phosphate 3-phosphatidyltransferase